MTDVAKVAAGLTKAQRRLLIALPDNGAAASIFWNGEHRGFANAFSILRVLTKRGLAGVFGQVTPLGLAVRAHIKDNEQ